MNAQILRERVANDISAQGIPYNEALKIMTTWGMFDNWEEEELYTRPVNVDELADCIAEAL